MSFRHRLLPWPLLGLYDYIPSAVFRCDVDATLQQSNDLITVDIQYQLQSSQMQDLITQKQADYVAQFTCRRTGSRVISQAGHQPADTYRLIASEFPGEFEVVPFVIAIQDIKGFRCNDLVPEIREMYPEGFDIPKWGYLAVGGAHNVNPLPLLQMFSLVSGNQVQDGMFAFDVSHDDIRIVLSIADFKSINRWRYGQTTLSESARDSLFAALYQGALTHALQQLEEAEERLGWVSSLRSQLEELAAAENLGRVPWGDMHYKAYEWAQRLLCKASKTDYPLGLFLRAHARQAESNYGD